MLIAYAGAFSLCFLYIYWKFFILWSIICQSIKVLLKETSCSLYACNHCLGKKGGVASTSEALACSFSIMAFSLLQRYLRPQSLSVFHSLSPLYIYLWICKPLSLLLHVFEPYINATVFSFKSGCFCLILWLKNFPWCYVQSISDYWYIVCYM